ncbi:MAG: cytochrome c biogenesis protein CcdA [Candidatus Yanofskybacteria bacterium]|nr:cytochrome c biogenesis protein CcdA [Candidatus Yanofskybacteria bacterium]
MIEFGIALILSSFVAGVFTFFAPCTLPLVPAFLGVIAGVGPEELNDPEKLKRLRWKIFSNAVFYVLGFSLVFILFGVAFSFLGKIFVIRLWLQRIGGILIILFGLFLSGLLKLPWLSAEKQIRLPKLFTSSNKTNSFGIGVLFALGWSPCVGPLLGSILFLASGSGTVAQGTFLLMMFSLGLAIPFLITALLIGKAFTVFAKWGRMLKVINVVAGIFLIALGALLISNQFTPVFNQFRGWLLQYQFYEEYINRFL